MNMRMRVLINVLYLFTGMIIGYGISTEQKAGIVDWVIITLAIMFFMVDFYHWMQWIKGEIRMKGGKDKKWQKTKTLKKTKMTTLT